MTRKWMLWAAIAAITTVSGAAGADDAEAAFDARAVSCPGPLSTLMSGSEETQRADPNGFGGAVITLDDMTNRVCFNLVWYGIDPPTMAHIHRGRRGVAGPPVVTLFDTPTPRYYRRAAGCIDDVDPSLMAELHADPGAFYVNVHDYAYPNGAIRGQLICGF